MRQQLLHGYLLHQRRYRENSRLVHFFSLEFGRVDGVIRQEPPPLYQPVLVYATGKTTLRTLSKLEWVGQPKHLAAGALFAGFYANELLVRLLPIEEANPNLFAAYGQLLDELQQLPQIDQGNITLIKSLRRFECILLRELGYAITFEQDVNGQLIVANQYYRYDPREGFIKSNSGELGKDILAMHELLQTENGAASIDVLQMLTRVYRKLFSMLLGDKPLKSRELWVASQNAARPK